MDIQYKIFRRQFFLGRHIVEAGPEWKNRRLKSGLYLSWCSSLPVSFVYDQLQNEWILIGDAIQAAPGLPSPTICIQKFTKGEDIFQHYYSWSGRWLLIGQNEVHPDASGLLGCYYSSRHNYVELSSTPYFLTGSEVPDKYLLRKGIGIECYPLPGSGQTSVSKVLPTQVLDLTTGRCRHRNLFTSLQASPPGEVLEELADVLTTTLVNGQQYFRKNITIALTAGYDSRLLMAVLKYARLPFDAVTFEVPLLTPCDRKVPGPLAAASSITHRFIRRRDRNIGNYEKYNIHSCYHAIERDRELMLFQQFDQLDTNSVLVRGGCFEIGSSPYNRYLPEARLSGEQIVQQLKGNKYQAESLDRWLRWIDLHPISGLDWRDRYYLEQRLGGWLSSTEQALDLVNIDRFVPANSALFFNLLLKLPLEMRINKSHQVELIRLLAPELLEFPFNPLSSYLTKQYRRLLFKIDKLKQPKKLPASFAKDLNVNIRKIKEPVNSTSY